MTAKVISKPLRWRADKLATRLNLTEAERKRLRITTIGAVDLTRQQRKDRRRARDRALKHARRLAAGAKPRAEYEAVPRRQATAPLSVAQVRRQHTMCLYAVDAPVPRAVPCRCWASVGAVPVHGPCHQTCTVPVTCRVAGDDVPLTDR